MPKTTAALMFILLLLTCLLGYNYFFKPFLNLEEQNQEEELIADQNAVNEQVGPYFGFASIQEVVDSMEPSEKLAQLMLVPLDLPLVSETQALQASPSANIATNSANLGQVATSSADTASTDTLDTVESNPSNNQPNEWDVTLQTLASLKPGGVTIFGSQLEYQETAEKIVDIQQQIPLAPILAVDHEGGTVQRLSGEGFTQLPSWREQCALEYDEAQALWQQSATELSQVGINMILAPMVDFATTNSVLGSRICSGDTEKVVTYGLGMSDVFFTAGIQPVFKHFPGIGEANVDLHTSFDTVQVGEEEANVYQALLEAPKEYTTAVMVSHVGVENQYANVPCSLSDTCINELKSAEPTVLVVSDALEMKSATSDGRTLLNTIELAIRAGNHVLVFGPEVTVSELADSNQELVAVYEDSGTFRNAVDRAVTRVLEYKYSMMVTDDEIDETD
jgi:beta-N-acetylhexosaminidase